MKIMWTNKYSGEQGYVKIIRKDKGYFENTFDINEAKNFHKYHIASAMRYLSECCADNDYAEVKA